MTAEAATLGPQPAEPGAAPDSGQGTGSGTADDAKPGTERDVSGLAARLADDARIRQWDPVTELVMRTFRLNGVFLAVGESLAKPYGLTATRWQVLGAVLRTPMTVAGIAREMGLARQTVLPMANALVAAGLADYRDNPHHRRARLLEPTEAGRAAIARIAPGQRTWAGALAEEVGVEELRACVQTLNRVVEVAGRLMPEANSIA